MIQSIYTLISNADIVSCKKGEIITSEPIPLLRDKYLSEYRTELEKAKVRKNLGIADSYSMLWGNLLGDLENLKDLILYVESKSEYTNSVSESITTVKEALDYALKFIGLYEDNTNDIELLKKDIVSIQSELSEVTNDVLNNSLTIEIILEKLTSIDEQIISINEQLLNIDVDLNITLWITKALENSSSIELTEDNTLLVNISEDENNAVIILNGIYVKNLEPSILEALGLITTNSENIEKLKEDIPILNKYVTELPDETTIPEDVGGFEKGTTVAELKEKTISLIVDILLFPAFVRDLIMPTLTYSMQSLLVEINTPNLNITLTFTKNDAGEESSRTDTITFNDSPVEDLISYNLLGKYVYNGTVLYSAGEYLVDNRGEVTEKRVEEGSISTSITITTTYPWYAGNTDSTSKLKLVAFNQSSDLIDINLDKKAVIKLPGQNTTLDSFKVNGGLGFLDVDLNGWEESTEQINDYTYKVWTKKDNYISSLPHQIKFTLKE